MRQATGYTGILSSTIKESAKLDRMEELVEDAINNGKKVVIFSNWTQMTDVIMDRLSVKGYEPVIITGQTPDVSRQAYINYFQNEDKCKVMIGTIGALGTGVTLTAGTVLIFMDHPWNRALYDQAVDRCHRIGQNSNITIYNLLTKNTIDERIWELVQKKGLISDAIVDGKLCNDKREVLEFLLS
jgi:SNF2 family DNA or RNA helicase